MSVDSNEWGDDGISGGCTTGHCQPGVGRWIYTMEEACLPRKFASSTGILRVFRDGHSGFLGETGFPSSSEVCGAFWGWASELARELARKLLVISTFRNQELRILESKTKKFSDPKAVFFELKRRDCPGDGGIGRNDCVLCSGGPHDVRPTPR